MGFRTIVIISNDSIHYLKDAEHQKKFCEEILGNLSNMEPVSDIGGLVDAQVVRSQHNDDPQLVLAYRGMVIPIHGDPKNYKNIYDKGIFNHAYKKLIKMVPEMIRFWKTRMKEVQAEIEK